MKPLNEIIREVETSHDDTTRRGQRYWNAVSIELSLTESHRLLNEIVGTDADPFYDDENIMRFLIAVNEILETHGSE